MITVVVGLDSRGNLVSADASGHAGAGKFGTDIACAAATALLRTTLAALSAAGGSVVVESATHGRGSLSFRVTASAESDSSILRYAALFLREGLSSLVEEYPESVGVRWK